MHGSVNRIESLIRDRPRYSRVSAGAEGFHSVDLATVAQDILSDLEPSIDETGASLELSALQPVDAERLRMRKLFTHLLENAIKFR